MVIEQFKFHEHSPRALALITVPRIFPGDAVFASGRRGAAFPFTAPFCTEVAVRWRVPAVVVLQGLE